MKREIRLSIGSELSLNRMLASTIRKLWNEGSSKRAIAKSLGIGPDYVTVSLRAGQRRGVLTRAYKIESQRRVNCAQQC